MNTIMDATLYGQVTHPAIIFCGAWDPILPEHLQIVNRMIDNARSKGLCNALIIFDPAPASFVLKKINSNANWVNYTETNVTIQYLLEAGLDAVLHVHFKPEYLDMGVTEFFDTVLAHMRVAEFWFGAKQSLGRGPAGSQTEIVKQARERQIRLRRLSIVDTEKMGNQARFYLSNGSIEKAIACTGHPPIRKRPSSLQSPITLPWSSGIYRAIPTRYNSFKNATVKTLEPIPITMEQANPIKGINTVAFNWPDPQIEYLTFVSGPNDIQS